MFTEKKYMDFSDVKLKMPLPSIKRAEDKNDTLAVPDSIVNGMLRFFRREQIDYHVIENPALSQQLQADMQLYIDIDSSYDLDDAVLLITPFDKSELFQWSLQVFGETIDPSYRAYLDSEKKRGEDYITTCMNLGRRHA